MGVAYTDAIIMEASISGDPATFPAALHLVLTAAGWTSAVYGTGYLYACVSPQGLAVNVRIWDPEDALYPDCLAFQWIQAVSPLTTGLIHHIRMHTAATFRVWANCCSLFIGRQTVAALDHLPWAVCGGVAWAAGLTTPTDQCAAQSPAAGTATNELWWSTGDDGGPGEWAIGSWRTQFFAPRYSFCRNGTITSQERAISSTALQLGMLRAPGYTFFMYSYYVQWTGGFEADGLVYDDGEPVASDALIAHQGVWYGQLWDACLLSAPMAMEATETIYETVPDRTTDWINYMHPSAATSERCYSLLLLHDSPAGRGGNIAY